jgi:hypothetical protein
MLSIELTSDKKCPCAGGEHRGEKGGRFVVSTIFLLSFYKLKQCQVIIIDL